MNFEELKNQFISFDRFKKGGQKEIYKAIDEKGNAFAVKIIADVDDKRVLQEIKILETIKINNVPNIVSSGMVSFPDGTDRLFIVENFVEGVSLNDFISSGNRFDLKTAISVLEQLLIIEVELEKNHLIHRDIKPGNIILKDDGSIILLDFGIAKAFGWTQLTDVNAPFGPCTPGYAPLEQLNNERYNQDARTDLYAIGVTIYECCTGVNPFRDKATNFIELIGLTLTYTPTHLVLKGDNNLYFSNYIAMLMSKSQSKRPSSAEKAYSYFLAIKDSFMNEV